MRAAIYLRVSSASQEDNHSLPSQEESCRAYAADRGWTVVAVYREVFSGAYLDRPQLTRLRDAIARREVDRVLVHQSDRLGRNQDDRVFLRVEAKRYGAAYLSVLDPTDDTEEGRLVEYVMGYGAALQRRAIIEATQRGIRGRLQAGKRYPGCKPPYGYRWADDAKGALVVYEPEAVVVRRIFDAVANGASLRGLAAALERDGIPTPNPRRADPTKPPMWHIRSLHTILHNPAYKGVSVGNRKQAVAPASGGERKTSTRLRPEEEWTVLPDGTAPAILSPELWERVQGRLITNRERSERSAEPKQDALLRGGFVRCGYCDGPMHVNRNAYGAQYRCENRRRHPVCGKGQHIAAGPLDRQIWETTAMILTNPGVIAAKLRREANPEATAAELAALDASRTDIVRQEANLTDAIARVTTPLAVEALVRKLDALAAQRSALGRQRADAQLRHWGQQAAARQVTDLEAWCRRERREVGRLDYEGKRQRLERLGVVIHVFRPGRFAGRFDMTLRPEGFTLQDMRDPEEPAAATAFPTPRCGSTARSR